MDQLAIPEDDHPVADLCHLPELVGDVDQGDAPGPEVAHNPKQALDLDLGEDGRGLVQDEDPGFVHEGLADLHQLFLRRRKVRDARIGIDGRRESAQQLPGPLMHRGPVEEAAPASDLVPEVDVLGDRKIGAEVEFLGDDGDPSRLGSRRPAEGHWLAIEEDGPRRRLVDAGEDLHEGRFPGAVLANEAQDLACMDFQGDVVKHGDRRKILADLLSPHDSLWHPNSPLLAAEFPLGVDAEMNREIKHRPGSRSKIWPIRSSVKRKSFKS